jgi:hypothetical protein
MELSQPSSPPDLYSALSSAFVRFAGSYCPDLALAHRTLAANKVIPSLPGTFPNMSLSKS